MKIPKEVIREYVKNEKFTNTNDIMESIKSMFADVLNEVLQCEMDEQLGYDKHERTESGEEKKNYRKGTWDKDPLDIYYEDITLISFRNRYVKYMSKYVHN